jgi:hypothetical protein
MYDTSENRHRFSEPIAAQLSHAKDRPLRFFISGGGLAYQRPFEMKCNPTISDASFPGRVETRWKQGLDDILSGEITRLAKKKNKESRYFK